MRMTDATSWEDVFGWVDQAEAWAREVALVKPHHRRAMRADLLRNLEAARASGAAAGDVALLLESRFEGHLRFEVVAADAGSAVLH